MSTEFTDILLNLIRIYRDNSLIRGWFTSWACF